jgi:peptide/nickel transport system substrate-binding protein
MSEKLRAARGFTRRQFLQYSAAGLSTALLAACAPSGAPAPAAESGAAPAAGGPTQGGTLRLMGHQEVAGMSPNNQGASVQETVIYAIHNAVVKGDHTQTTQPVLAESYEVAEDGLTYTFHLHQGVKFHDGKELTAADVKYTYDFYRDEANAMTIVGDFAGIDTVETPDDYTVVVNMATVNAASLVNWGETPIVQSEYHAEVGEETYATAPIGTGAFKLVNWVPAEVVELEAFADHFRGAPHIAAIRQEVVPDAAVRSLALESGDSDSNLWPLLVEDSQRLAEEPDKYTVIKTSTGGVKHFPLNNKLPQLSDKRVRQAMLHALDRQRIIDELWNGAAAIAHTNLGRKHTFYSLNDSPDIKRYDFDPAAANALLDEAGWTMGADGVREKDGVKLSFTCTTITGDTARRPIAELAQQMLKEVGVDMQLEEAPVAAILEGMHAGTMEASLFNWTYGDVDPDPSATLRSDGGDNWNSYSNPRMDELIDQGLQVVDPEQRKPIYDEIQQIVVEDVPMLYLQWDDWYNVFSSRVKGLPTDATDAFSMYFNGLHEWWLDPVEV